MIPLELQLLSGEIRVLLQGEHLNVPADVLALIDSAIDGIVYHFMHSAAGHD